MAANNPAAGDSAKVLADHLTEMQITIDDNTQFCRIIRYYFKYKELITFRSYNSAKITITLNYYKYE